MQVCGAGEQKLFCKDYVENIQVNLVLSAVGCFLVLLSLVRSLAAARSFECGGGGAFGCSKSQF